MIHSYAPRLTSTMAGAGFLIFCCLLSGFVCGGDAGRSLVNEQNCHEVIKNSNLSLEINHCEAHFGGSFDIQNTNKSASFENWRFKGRIVGTTINQLHFKYHHHRWTANYNLPTGNYKASIYLRYTDFHVTYFEDEKLELEPLTNLNILQLQVSVPTTTRCGPGISHLPASWTGTNASTVPGHLSSFKIEDNEFEDLTYLPHGCLIDPIEDLTYWARGQNGTTSPPIICLFGDSQTRHLSNALHEVIWGKHNFFHNPSSDGNPPGNSLSIRYMKTGMSNNASNYEFIDSGEFEGTKSQLGQWNCSFILLNFGQWQISWAMGKHPETISKYRSSVNMALLNAITARSSAQLFWLTTHAHGEMSVSLIYFPPVSYTYVVSN